MEYRQLGKTQIELSVLTFGAWAIGQGILGGIERRDAVDALRKAYELGSTSIDTAPLYGLGLSEEVVAEAIAGIPRDRLQLLTKCGMVWEGNRGHEYLKNIDFCGRTIDLYLYGGRESIMRECENSLRRLKTDYIDLYSVHWPDPTTPIEETMEALSRLKQQGKIRAAGVCNHSLAQMQGAEAVVDVASNKVRYSMLNRGIEQDLIPYCFEAQKSILAYSVLQRGILTGRDLPKFIWKVGENLREAALYEPENLRRIRTFLSNITPIALDHGVTVTQLGIRWVIDQPGVTVALLGATSPDQIVFDAQALDVSLTATEKLTINGLLAELEETLELEPVPGA